MQEQRPMSARLNAAQRISCMRACLLLCKETPDAFAHEREAVSTDVLWIFVIISVGDDTG